MDVTAQKLLYATAGIDVVHIGVYDDLEHHPGMIGTTAGFLIELQDIVQIQTVDYTVD